MNSLPHNLILSFSILQTGISNLLYKINGVGVHFWKCNMHLDICTQMKVNSFFWYLFCFFFGVLFFYAGIVKLYLVDGAI